MHHQPFAPKISEARLATSTGVLTARIIAPRVASDLPPLVVLHGISRNACELAELFVPEAIRTGRKIVIPHFSAEHWPVFQRPCRKARPDQALLALLSLLANTDSAFADRVDFFGHSGGAQLGHRFAMLFPHRVGHLNLAAAGWYCLPDASMSYPYGLGINGMPDSLTWARRHGQMLPEYLQLPVRVFVGTADTGRDASLRQTPALDRIQGATRFARAETFVAHFRDAAIAQGITPDVCLTYLPGVTHDSAQALRSAELTRLVTDRESVNHISAI